ncbi:uncharacterized protein LOC128721076 [Anopheles nili]|uniref:uncharacterized protein LOC128721076 n=1 Tax=Anopheles nili TaxID=185578 RepID=UPI00237B329E|nr:uncharacterized protein LOC128721076 [Anopheles nili]
MSSRKSRLSLSKDIHKDAKTSNARRTPQRTSVGRKSTDSHTNEENSPSQNSEYSPMIPLTQDSSIHAINGVSWEWNSPQRMQGPNRAKIAAARMRRPKPEPLYCESPESAPAKPTGFNKFISKLNLLMEKENMDENLDVPEPLHEPLGESCFEDEFSIEHNPRKCEETVRSPDNTSNDDIFDEAFQVIPNNESRISIGAELDDSKLDVLLVEASQTIEQELNKCAPVTSVPVPKNPVPCFSIPVEMNDSDMDGFLVQASLMVEEKLSDSSQESSTNSNALKKLNERDTINLKEKRIFPTVCHEKDTVNSTSLNDGTRQQCSMSQDELKALIEKKRQEALRRLENNRLRRIVKGTNSHG